MIFTWYPNDFWHKRNINNFDAYNVLLAVAANIPVRLKTGFVLQGHIWEILSPCIIYPAVIFLCRMNVILQNWVLCRETEVKSSQIIACVYPLDSFMAVLLVFICRPIASH